MATDFSFIRSQRGKNKLFSEGYIYKMERVSGEKSYWVCHLPDFKGRCIQTEDELSSTQEHNLFGHVVYVFVSENKAILTLKKNLFIPFL